jgi:hypothetical protein
MLVAAYRRRISSALRICNAILVNLLSETALIQPKAQSGGVIFAFRELSGSVVRWPLFGPEWLA